MRSVSLYKIPHRCAAAPSASTAAAAPAASTAGVYVCVSLYKIPSAALGHTPKNQACSSSFSERHVSPHTTRSRVALVPFGVGFCAGHARGALCRAAACAAPLLRPRLLLLLLAQAKAEPLGGGLPVGAARILRVAAAGAASCSAGRWLCCCRGRRRRACRGFALLAPALPPPLCHCAGTLTHTPRLQMPLREVQRAGVPHCALARLLRTRSAHGGPGSAGHCEREWAAAAAGALPSLETA